MRRTESAANTNTTSGRSTTGYDWTRFGRHQLRVPAAVLIDSPLGRPGHGWLATLWPACDAEAGWARMLWEPQSLHGGWLVPARLAGGDVLEFGADHSGEPVRWYGILHTYDAVEWLTIQGPYDGPRAAHDHAEQLLARLRYEPPLRAGVAGSLCTRTRARRR